MTLQSSTRKIYFGVADRRQMFRLFDRHAQRPNRWENDDSALFAGEWFEIARAEHDYMLDILPPLWMRGEMFAMREFLTESVTSVFHTLRIDGTVVRKFVEDGRHLVEIAQEARNQDGELSVVGGGVVELPE